MTRRRLIFHPRVEEDLDAIIAHYAARDPALPGRFRARLMEQVERIELFPESGAILFESYRRAPLKRFRTSPCTSLATTGLSCSPSWTFVAIPPGSKGRSPTMPNRPENAFVQVRPCFPAPTDDGQQPPKPRVIVPLQHLRDSPMPRSVVPRSGTGR